MSELPPLPDELRPYIVDLDSEISLGVAAEAREELKAAAAKDENRMYGFFPQAEGLFQNLPACQAFMEEHPVLSVHGEDFYFDWMKYAESSLSSTADFHRDASRATGMTAPEVDPAQEPATRIQRIIANLHALPHLLGWVDANVEGLPWRNDRGFIILAYEPPASKVRRLSIPGVRKDVVQAGVVYVSHTAHTARPMVGFGHFLASWSREQILV